MKFGKEFRTHLEETLPDWRDKFLCYKPLKKLLKSIPDPAPEVDDGSKGAVDEWFVGLLNEELEKFNDFYVDKEEEFVIRLQELKERIQLVGEQKPETNLNEEMQEIRKAFVQIHGEMVLLENYSSLNFMGLVKILKKYDKRTGGLLRLPYIQRTLRQPFFSTEPLTRLVRESEANLEMLFPTEAEAEVVDGAASSSANSVQSDNTDLYRGTLAAMRAINGLRKGSSTSGPLSLAQFFPDAAESGDLTSETSHSSDDHIQDERDINPKPSATTGPTS